MERLRGNPAQYTSGSAPLDGAVPRRNRQAMPDRKCVSSNGLMRTAVQTVPGPRRSGGLGICQNRHSLVPLTGRASFREDGPSTGKPDAGNPPVRFGGWGGRDQPAFPTPI